jgi:hypothetical protein
MDVTTTESSPLNGGSREDHREAPRGGHYAPFFGADEARRKPAMRPDDLDTIKGIALGILLGCAIWAVLILLLRAVFG